MFILLKYVMDIDMNPNFIMVSVDSTNAFASSLCLIETFVPPPPAPLLSPLEWAKMAPGGLLPAAMSTNACDRESCFRLMLSKDPNFAKYGTVGILNYLGDWKDIVFDTKVLPNLSPRLGQAYPGRNVAVHVVSRQVVFNGVILDTS